MKSLIVSVALAAGAAMFFWKAPAKYKDGKTWFYICSVVGGSYLLLVRPFK